MTADSAPTIVILIITLMLAIDLIYRLYLKIKTERIKREIAEMKKESEKLKKEINEQIKDAKEKMAAIRAGIKEDK